MISGLEHPLKRAAKLLENTNLLSNLTQEKEKAT
jgi:hypothetical protein